MKVSIKLLALLLIVQWALTLGCRCTGPRCDFVCDCKDCSDEQDCGYRGMEFVCDFEDAGKCGWTDKLAEDGYMWERRQRGHPLPDSGPSSDYTTGTSTGWFMGVTAVTASISRTAVLTSPMMNQSSPTCRLRLYYFLWDSGSAGLGNSPLWMSVWTPKGQSAMVWRPESSSVRSWKEVTVFLGRIPGPFNIQIHSSRQQGRRGDVAIDQLEFMDCALPVVSGSGSCEVGLFQCKLGGCVKENAVCDGTDDCGDQSDEENCGQYKRCNFDNDLCEWDLRSLSSLKWTRTSQMNISDSEILKGPGRDHSTNLASGHFLYVTKPAELKSDWASFHSPSLEATDSTHPCHMTMYTHQFGGVSGGLSVLVAEKQIYPVWERGGFLGDLWVKNEVEFVVNSTFQILFVAAIRDLAYGGIAVDDIILSPECRLSNESVSAGSYPKPPKKPCTEASKICDFHTDCTDGQDEAQCGDFSYEQGSMGWTDTSKGSQGWKLMHESNNDSTEVFLYVTEASGQQLTEAQTRTPLLGPSGPACTLKFSYSLTGNNAHIGEVSVAVVDSIMGSLPQLWGFSGRTGENPAESWVKHEVYIGARDHRFQLEFRARAQKLDSGRIAVKDVYYVDCNPEYIPSTSDGPSCNFEVDLCGWYQDQMDNYDWSIKDGIDHTIGSGKSVAVDMWTTTLRGLSGRLLSLRQDSLDQHCLSFFYKLYGPDTGTLSVKLLYSDDSEQLLWTRSGAHGNMWHEGHCSVPQQIITFQLAFEAVRSGFDGQVAIDDVAFVKGPCSLPTVCSFEGQRCAYISKGAAVWVHQSWDSMRNGPKTDHSLETAMGYYMLAHSGAAVLPKGSVMTLISPVRHGVTHTECVYFWYHMGGHDPGILSVYIKPVNGGRITIFSNNLNQGDVWRLGTGNVSWHGDWQLQFEVKGQGGKDTYIAIDDISLSTHSCPTPDKVCDLEQGLCGWSNSQNHELDHLDWELSNLLSETHYSTPPYDHTLANERGHFLFLPHTLRDTTAHNAWLLSPHLPPTKGTCLYFWVYQSQSHDSRLVVWQLSEESKRELLNLTEAVENWRRFRLNITSEKEYQIVFEGLKGVNGVLALDDFGYTIGINCVGEQTEQKKSTDNSGKIAASVIIAILLMVTVAVLLFFYLKRHEQARDQSQASTGAYVRFENELYEPNSSGSDVVWPEMEVA